jgi:hypothetical protein
MIVYRQQRVRLPIYTRKLCSYGGVLQQVCRLRERRVARRGALARRTACGRRPGGSGWSPGRLPGPGRTPYMYSPRFAQPRVIATSPARMHDCLCSATDDAALRRCPTKRITFSDSPPIHTPSTQSRPARPRSARPRPPAHARPHTDNLQWPETSAASQRGCAPSQGWWVRDKGGGWVARSKRSPTG